MNGNGTFYRWALGIVVAVAMFFGGMATKGFSLNKQVTTNTVKIENLENGLNQINAKLDRLLERGD